MARKKNPDSLRKVYNELADQMLKYGEEGANDLKDIVDAHDPESIFRMDSGPHRSAAMSALIFDMKDALADLSRASNRAQLPKRSPAPAAEGGARRTRAPGPEREKPEREKPRTEPGGYEGFRWVCTEHPNGWSVKITRTGKSLTNDGEPGFPKLVDHPSLLAPDKRSPRIFATLERAEWQARNVIKQGLLWYAEKGLPVPYMHRRTELGRAGIVHRTAEESRQNRALRDAEAEARRAKEAEEARIDRARQVKIRRSEGESPGQRSQSGQLRVEQVLRAHDERKRAGKRLDSEIAQSSSPAKTEGPLGYAKVRYIPRGNPSSPATFVYSAEVALRQGEKSQEGFKKYYDKYEESKRAGKPNAPALMKAYEHIENARVNYLAANRPAISEKAGQIKSELRSEIIDLAKHKHGAGPIENPSERAHLAIGDIHMSKAESYWNKYTETRSLPTLIKAFGHIVLAKHEFGHAGADEEKSVAGARLKLIEAELRKLGSE